MGQHIQRPDGKMAGSIGDGRSGAPTAQPGVPTSTAGAASAPSLTAALTALTPTSASPAPQLLVPDAHASWGMDIDDLCLACGRDISEWSAGHAGALERTIVGARMPDPALRVFNGYDIGARTKITGRVCATCLPSVDTAAGQPVADDRAIEQIDVGDDCVYCGTDTSPGSSSYVNRIPAGTSGQDMDGAQLRAFSQYAIGAHTRVEGHACPGCMTRDCDRCGHPIAMDED
ncbi:MAG: hypothetical protein QG661_2955, partial [Actinomycetota bacterium]|nr:hypothetical protein [Actinomycetota bacterium]